MESLFVMVFAQFVIQTNSFERSHDPSHPRAATTSLDCALTDTQTHTNTNRHSFRVFDPFARAREGFRRRVGAECRSRERRRAKST